MKDLKEAVAWLGPQLAQAALTHLKGEPQLALALERCDLEAIAAVPGISERRAIELLRHLRGIADEEGFLATAPARRVHDEVLERLRGFAATPQGRNRLRLLGPLPDAAAAERSAQAVMADKATVARLDRKRVRALLARLRPPQAPPPRMETGRVVLVQDPQLLDRLAKQGYGRWASLGGMEDVERAGGYDLALFVPDDGADLDHLPNLVEVPAGTTACELFPEATLAWFTANRDAIEATAELSALLGAPGAAAQALALLAQLPPPPSEAPLRPAVEAVRAELDARLKERLATVTITGADLLASLGRKLPAPVQRAVDACLQEGRDLLRERTGVAFQPFVGGHPVAIDEEELRRVEAAQAFRRRAARHHDLARAAKALHDLRDPIRKELAAHQEFEVRFALGCFAHHYDLHPARFGSHLAFGDSVHLDLAGPRDEPVQRIAYHIGGDETVAILTGANSGGKTTLLEHLAQLVLMARLGLPVVGAGVEVPWIDELHYITARRSLDAGAFETFLRSFLPLALGHERRLVLADEVESVTEMEAAARILGFFLDRLQDSPSLAVVVSHMAQHVLRHTTAPVRLDGIEATGLDAHNRLVVDRMPRIGQMARSTPELIVQRLAATTKGAEQGLYKQLLATFTPQEPTLEMAPKMRRKA
ncbi:MAG: mismatch repair protein MutS2 [Thermoplasmata archaeon]|jgi:hypothetical protein|nr:mismatch repair protein MutS2 [Thermoplasmata archaeon]